MHFDEQPVEECAFWAKCLSALNVWDYAYLGRDWDEYYFVKKVDNNEYVVKEIITLNESDIEERMWNDFDAHDAWVDAVRNGDTDRGYDDWQEDINIWDEMDSDNYFSCPQDIVDILHVLWLWSSTYSCDDWYYLDQENTWTLNKDRLDFLYRRFDTYQEFNKELREDIEKKFWFNQIEFLAAEPIR